MTSLSSIARQFEKDARLGTEQELTTAYNANFGKYQELNTNKNLDSNQTQDAVRMRRALNETRTKIENLRSSQPTTCPSLSLDQGLGITGFGSLALSLAVPASATVALPLSLTILGALGVKKMVEGCSKPSKKVKTKPSTFTSDRRGMRPEGKRAYYDPVRFPLMAKVRTTPKINVLRKKHSGQIDEFHNWAKSATAKKDWSQFHNSHYDWWAFPISRPSSNQPKYAKYAITSQEAQALKGDAEFMAKYRHGVKLVMQSYGFDVEKGVLLNNGGKYAGGSKHYRLQKILGSLKLFGETDLYNKVLVFATHVGESDDRYF